MSDEPNIGDPAEWAREIIAHATAKMGKSEAIIDNVLRRASVEEITNMINAAAAHYFGDFDVDFVEACISAQMAAELKRRMQSIVGNQGTLGEITAEAETPASVVEQGLV